MDSDSGTGISTFTGGNGKSKYPESERGVFVDAGDTRLQGQEIIDNLASLGLTWLSRSQHDTSNFIVGLITITSRDSDSASRSDARLVSVATAIIPTVIRR